MRLIDASALWELMRTYDDYQGAKEAHDLELIHRDSILFAIENAPTVDAVPVVHGYWIYEQHGKWIYAKCNLCGKVQDVRSKYCPNCGAMMDGKEKDNATD